MKSVFPCYTENYGSFEQAVGLVDRGYSVRYMFYTGTYNEMKKEESKYIKQGWETVDFSMQCTMSRINSTWTWLMKKKPELDFEI